MSKLFSLVLLYIIITFKFLKGYIICGILGKVDFKKSVNINDFNKSLDMIKHRTAVNVDSFSGF